MDSHIAIVVAIGRNRELGKNNDLLWHIPDDLKRFKALTKGHPIIMGRKTWESLPEKSRPLPDRTNIVITRDERYEAPGAAVTHSLEEALAVARTSPGADEIHIGGGAQLYAETLPLVDRLYLTLVDDEKEADTYFPAYEGQFRKKIFEEEREWNGLRYGWVNLERG